MLFSDFRGGFFDKTWSRAHSRLALCSGDLSAASQAEPPFGLRNILRLTDGFEGASGEGDIYRLVDRRGDESSALLGSSSSES